MYETFPHTADLGLRIRAASRESLFEEAARGLFSMLVADLQSVRARDEVRIEVDADEVEYQLSDWLSELLYRFDTQHLLLSEFHVEFDDSKLIGVCRGESLDPERHFMDHEVKAITYHGLRAHETGDGWLAEVIVDI